MRGLTIESGSVELVAYEDGPTKCLRAEEMVPCRGGVVHAQRAYWRVVYILMGAPPTAGRQSAYIRCWKILNIVELEISHKGVPGSQSGG